LLCDEQTCNKNSHGTPKIKINQSYFILFQLDENIRKKSDENRKKRYPFVSNIVGMFYFVSQRRKISEDFILLFISAKVAGVKSDGATLAKGGWGEKETGRLATSSYLLSGADSCLKQSFKKRGNNV
jgi:hypothetical protein